MMYLDKIKPGKLLEIGCGNGKRLVQFKARGWEVEGQEIDFEAAELARTRYNLNIQIGPLEDLPIKDDTFDAIIMNHVIEHVHDPKTLLANCWRLLKPGGNLVVVTPNIESLGHKKFGASWRDLDPPRHIRIFSPMTLSQIAQDASFNKWYVWTTAANAQVIAAGSLDIQHHGRHVMGSHLDLRTHIASIFFQLYAMGVNAVRKSLGEECVLKAVK